MKKLVIGLALLVAIFLLGCQAQSAKFDFGKYYKIDNYNIQVPFAGHPHVSPRQANNYMSYVSYQYAFPQHTDDINFLYGTDVISIKYDTLFKTEELKLKFVAGQFGLMYETIMSGKLVDEKKAEYHGAPAYMQKIRIKPEGLPEMYIQAIFFSHKDVVLRMFTFTPIENEDNPKIQAFFESVKFE